MNWTKEHSKNAVAAKSRLRLSPPDWTQVKRTRNKINVRRSKAKWRIQIRDLEHGDSLTLLLYRLPWPARYVDAQGKEFSAAKLARMLVLLLAEAP